MELLKDICYNTNIKTILWHVILNNYHSLDKIGYLIHSQFIIICKCILVTVKFVL